MRFALINVEAFIAGIMPVVVVIAEGLLTPDQILTIGQNLQIEMLGYVGRNGGQIPFVVPQVEGGRLFYVNPQDDAILRPLFKGLVWSEIFGWDAGLGG